MNKGRKFPPEIISAEEMLSILSRCNPKAPTGIRNRAMIATMYRCGTRITETLDLKAKDIDTDKGTLRVLHGKGDKARTIGVDTKTLELIQLWLERRKNLDTDWKSPLFCTLKGTPIQSDYVRQVLRRLARKAGIEKRVHPHGLRHTFSSEARYEGIDIGVISKQLGHNSIATTAHYLDHIAPASVIEAIGGREW
jgi:site-specific recombinase XerD